MLLHPSPTATLGEKLWNVLLHAICFGVLGFLVLPLIVIVPLSFNAEPYFTFTPGMLHLKPEALSLRWYDQVLTDPQWRLAGWNSLVIGTCATVLATTLGTVAALGLDRRRLRGHAIILAVLQTPLIAPIIVVAAAIYFFMARLGLTQSLTGIVLAHTVLGAPFVVSTVGATLGTYDRNLTRASLSLGASPLATFRRVTVPIIAPGVFSGALFVFITSLDEVVVVVFLAGSDQRTLPRQMWSGLREQLSPAILAAATLLVIASILLLGTREALRRRGERLQGISAATH